MTATSFKLFSKSDFIDMGIALGDVYLLMEEMSSRLKLKNANDLKSLLRVTRENYMKKTNYPDKRCPRKHVNVQFRCYNFDRKLRKFKLVKESTGGGIRSERLNRTTSFEELMDRAKSLFFPYGYNNKKKSLDCYTYYLADCAMNKLTDRLQLGDVSNVPLTVQSYITKYSLKVVKFILMTKEMSSNQQILKLAIKDPSENNFEQELKEFPSAIVNHTNDIMNNFSEQLNYISTEVEDHSSSSPYPFAEVHLKSNAHEQAGSRYF